MLELKKNSKNNFLFYKLKKKKKYFFQNLKSNHIKLNFKLKSFSRNLKIKKLKDLTKKKGKIFLRNVRKKKIKLTYLKQKFIERKLRLNFFYRFKVYNFFIFFNIIKNNNIVFTNIFFKNNLYLYLNYFYYLNLNNKNKFYFLLFNKNQKLLFKKRKIKLIGRLSLTVCKNTIYGVISNKKGNVRYWCTPKSLGLNKNKKSFKYNLESVCEHLVKRIKRYKFSKIMITFTGKFFNIRKFFVFFKKNKLKIFFVKFKTKYTFNGCKLEKKKIKKQHLKLSYNIQQKYSYYFKYFNNYKYQNNILSNIKKKYKNLC